MKGWGWGELIRKLVSRLPERWRWTPHNLLAHPVGEVLFQLGYTKQDEWLHDHTMPEHEAGTGRG